ncbi:MAG: hypothetical protein AB1798_12770 [Spirochaetota bacterium]
MRTLKLKRLMSQRQHLTLSHHLLYKPVIILQVMKKILFSILLMVFTLSILACTKNRDHRFTDNDINLQTEYKGNNTWEYTVTVLLPNPCYDIETEVFIMESYPEQVIIEVEIIPPDLFEICVQVMAEKSKNGTFQASEYASISKRIKE